MYCSKNIVAQIIHGNKHCDGLRGHGVNYTCSGRCSCYAETKNDLLNLVDTVIKKWDLQNESERIKTTLMTIKTCVYCNEILTGRKLKYCNEICKSRYNIIKNDKPTKFSQAQHMRMAKAGAKQRAGKIGCRYM